MKLSIIINHYRTPEVLRCCLRSVKEDLEGAPFAWEIIVTDSATIDKTWDMMADEFPEVVFLASEENIGFGRSINLALKRARGEYHFIINADILVDEKGAIGRLIEYMDAHEEIGLLGPKLWNINNTWQQSAFRFYRPMTVIYRRTPLGKTPWGKRDVARFLMRDVFCAGDVTEPMDADWLMGSAMLVRKRDLEKVGGFDERYFMYFEDVDWARRFWEAGLKVVYYPKVTMYHHHFQSSKKASLWQSVFNKYARIHISSAIKYFKKFGLKDVRYGK